MTTQARRKHRRRFSPIILLCFLLTSSAWGRVFVYWTNSTLPPASEFGFSDLVLFWNDGSSPLLEAALKQGYRVYLQASPQQAPAAAQEASKHRLAGVIVNAQQSQREELEKALPQLRSAHPKLRFLVLDSDGKQPEMRGSIVIKRDSVLEVSSPTAQPWIDTNLALVRTEERSHPGQVPIYTFSWARSESGQEQRTLGATDYSLAVAEAGAFQADLILKPDERLQKSLSEHAPEAWKLWTEVRSYAKFYLGKSRQTLEPAANVAIVVDDLDANDEVMNLLARHNIPCKVLLPADLNAVNLEPFNVIAVFAKPDKNASERLTGLAAAGKIIVVVDAHGSYPWQKTAAVRLNEHALSYAVGTGKVLELSEPVSDPETFAQDIRRLLGKQNSLVSLWNGLTVIAVPYRERDGAVKLLEFVNYAGEPVRVQVQVRGSWMAVVYESPEHGCCQSLSPTEHNGFTEFVIPDLAIAGRVHLEGKQPNASAPSRN